MHQRVKVLMHSTFLFLLFFPVIYLQNEINKLHFLEFVDPHKRKNVESWVTKAKQVNHLKFELNHRLM